MEYVISCKEKPLLLNQERRMHWGTVGEKTKLWRLLGLAEARRAKIGNHNQITVTVEHFFKGNVPDVVACFPSVKAFIDGMVDAKVIPDDNPDHLLEVTFLAPVKAKDHEVKFTVKVVS